MRTLNGCEAHQRDGVVDEMSDVMNMFKCTLLSFVFCIVEFLDTAIACDSLR